MRVMNLIADNVLNFRSCRTEIFEHNNECRNCRASAMWLRWCIQL